MGQPPAGEGVAGPVVSRNGPVRVAADPFRIVAPQEGDRYEVPPGVRARYATLGLRAGGGLGRAVRWFVDGNALEGDRWALRPGLHVLRAESGGERAEVRIEVQ